MDDGATERGKGQLDMGPELVACDAVIVPPDVAGPIVPVAAPAVIAFISDEACLDIGAVSSFNPCEGGDGLQHGWQHPAVVLIGRTD